MKGKEVYRDVWICKRLEIVSWKLQSGSPYLLASGEKANVLGEFSENQPMGHIYFYLLPWLLHSKFGTHTKAETEYELVLGQELAKSQECCQGFEINCAIALEE